MRWMEEEVGEAQGGAFHVISTPEEEEHVQEQEQEELLSFSYICILFV